MLRSGLSTNLTAKSIILFADHYSNNEFGIKIQEKESGLIVGRWLTENIHVGHKTISSEYAV